MKVGDYVVYTAAFERFPEPEYEGSVGEVIAVPAENNIRNEPTVTVRWFIGPLAARSDIGDIYTIYQANCAVAGER